MAQPVKKTVGKVPGLPLPVSQNDAFGQLLYIICCYRENNMLKNTEKRTNGNCIWAKGLSSSSSQCWPSQPSSETLVGDFQKIPHGELRVTWVCQFKGTCYGTKSPFGSLLIHPAALASLLCVGDILPGMWP